MKGYELDSRETVRDFTVYANWKIKDFARASELYTCRSSNMTESQEAYFFGQINKLLETFLTSTAYDYSARSMVSDRPTMRSELSDQDNRRWISEPTSSAIASVPTRTQSNDQAHVIEDQGLSHVTYPIQAPVTSENHLSIGGNSNLASSPQSQLMPTVGLDVRFEQYVNPSNLTVSAGDVRSNFIPTPGTTTGVIKQSAVHAHNTSYAVNSGAWYGNAPGWPQDQTSQFQQATNSAYRRNNQTSHNTYDTRTY
jgi:hypothetical protein